MTTAKLFTSRKIPPGEEAHYTVSAYNKPGVPMPGYHIYEPKRVSGATTLLEIWPIEPGAKRKAKHEFLMSKRQGGHRYSIDLGRRLTCLESGRTVQVGDRKAGVNVVGLDALKERSDLSHATIDAMKVNRRRSGKDGISGTQR